MEIIENNENKRPRFPKPDNFIETFDPLHDFVLWIQWLSRWMPKFKISCRDHRSLQFISKLYPSVLTIPLEKLYANLFYHYFKPNVDHSPLQDQNLSRMHHDALNFFMLSIAPEMNVGFRFYLVGQ
jgi:hypothetical protein